MVKMACGLDLFDHVLSWRFAHDLEHSVTNKVVQLPMTSWTALGKASL